MCNFMAKIMPTNLAIDDNLINEAKRIGNHKTKKAVVTEALEEYIQRRKQMEIGGLFALLFTKTNTIIKPNGNVLESTG